MSRDNFNLTEAVTSGEDVAVKAVNKRYEGLVTVRNKAVKGKGAWYWAHLEPILIKNPETNLPKTVKIKCNLCDAAFSASNPSRTASEHLKRGTCPNFNSMVKPVSQLPPLASPSSQNYRKRSSEKVGTLGSSSNSYQVGMFDFSRNFDGINYSPLQIDQTPLGNSSIERSQQHLVLSGGKEDLGALALLEDSVKKIKHSKVSPGPPLSKDQVDSAVNLLADWFYESCGAVSFSALEHPSFKAFLKQLGLPSISQSEFLGPRLDSRFKDARLEAEARIRDAAFFQVASDGWEIENCRCGEERVVKFLVNLPNGTSVFQKVVYVGGVVPAQYVDEVLWETTRMISADVVQRCVGIVADKYKNKALRNLEIQHHWMVNLSCQIQGLISLIKDFSKELPLFRNVTDNCLKIATFFNSKSQIRNSIRKYRLQDVEVPGLIRVPLPKHDALRNFNSIAAMIEDVFSYTRVLHLVVLDDSYKVLCVEDSVARDVADMIQDVGFWNNLEAVRSLLMLIARMAKDTEAERPLVAQCLPLWQELRSKVKEWCSRFSVADGPVEKIVERRFKKNYHPAWAAAFVLDPQYLLKDESGKYLPPFRVLTEEQEKDVDKLIMRLVSKEEAHMALMDLMKWRSEGLDPLYAKAVQVKQRDSVTGKMKIAHPQSSRLVWETCLKDFKSLGKIASRLLFLQATSCGFKCNLSTLKYISGQGHSGGCQETAQKMIYVAANTKLERRDFSSPEEKDAELFGAANSADSMVNDVFADTHSL